MRIVLFIFLMLLAPIVFAEEKGYQGICSKASKTDIKGVEGLKNAEVLDNEIFFGSIVDSTELILLDRNNKKHIYSGINNDSELRREDGWKFTDGFEDVTIYLLKDGKYIFHAESKSSAPHFWGSCILSEAPISSYVGTLYIHPNKLLSEGKPNSCGLEFAAYVKDFVYNQGKKYYIVGSFGFNKTENKKVVPFLKVITKRVTAFGKFIEKPEKPFFAYLKFRDKNNSKSVLQNFDSDAPGGLFTLFNTDSTTVEIIKNALENKTISIMFNRNKGGYDLEVPIDLTVKSLKENGEKIVSLQPVSEFKKCIESIL
jgi:hypothetical protein